MDPMTLMAIGGALGLAKSQFIDAPQRQRAQNLAQTQARYSPWTGQNPQAPEQVDTLGNTMQGAAMGGALAQSPWFNKTKPDAGTMAGAVPLGDHPPSNSAPPFQGPGNYSNSNPGHQDYGNWAYGQLGTTAPANPWHPAYRGPMAPNG